MNENLSWEEKERLEKERLKPIIDRLVELSAKSERSWDESMEIGGILKKDGRALIDNYGPGLYLAEYTSENIAFIELQPDLFLEVSISGNFNVSLSHILNKAQADTRIDELLAFEEKGDK